MQASLLLEETRAQLASDAMEAARFRLAGPPAGSATSAPVVSRSSGVGGGLPGLGGQGLPGRASGGAAPIFAAVQLTLAEHKLDDYISSGAAAIELADATAGVAGYRPAEPASTVLLWFRDAPRKVWISVSHHITFNSLFINLQRLSGRDAGSVCRGLSTKDVVLLRPANSTAVSASLASNKSATSYSSSVVPPYGVIGVVSTVKGGPGAASASAGRRGGGLAWKLAQVSAPAPAPAPGAPGYKAAPHSSSTAPDLIAIDQRDLVCVKIHTTARELEGIIAVASCSQPLASNSAQSGGTVVKPGKKLEPWVVFSKPLPHANSAAPYEWTIARLGSITSACQAYQSVASVAYTAFAGMSASTFECL